MNDCRLDADEVARFQSDGYLLMPALFDAEEVALMRQALASDQGIANQRNTMAMRGCRRQFSPRRCCGPTPATTCSARSRAASGWWAGPSDCWAARSITTTPS